MRQSGDVVDALFAHPRLAEVYDPFDPDRGDLDAYLDMVEEFDASTVLDLGCGTGTFACLLAQRGLSVVAVDPAEASLGVARRKPGAERVQWVLGDASSVSGLQVDLTTMTGNVAQVFIDDQDWATALAAVHLALRPGGRLVFETRVPSRQAWRLWTREWTWRRVDIRG